jgi:hypothetical protein
MSENLIIDPKITEIHFACDLEKCKGGCCVLVYYDSEIAKCALERAYFEGKSDFRKPISCHLFPIRVRGEKLVYEEFSVCTPALNHGINENLLMYEFLKDSIIRRFGKEFYDNLEKFVVGVK